MEKRTIDLAEQLLGSVPKSEIADLIKLLQYYNRFAESDRTKTFQSGTPNPVDASLEREVKSLRGKYASQGSYITTGSSVCKCCGK